jgi:2-hydroxy-6-oxonona-2,4-dienedioate hydrolase
MGPQYTGIRWKSSTSQRQSRRHSARRNSHRPASAYLEGQLTDRDRSAPPRIGEQRCTTCGIRKDRCNNPCFSVDIRPKRISLGGAIAIFIGILVIGLLIMVYADYQRDIRQARERVLAGSQIADTPCGSIEYAVVGSGPPVLVVHGASGGFDQGFDVSKALVQSGFRVIAMSRFGYLRTPLPPDASPAAQADAYACLLDALNVSHAIVLGFSAGAPSSMQFALRHPERTDALVLMVPAAYPAHLEQRSGGAMPKGTSVGTKLLFDTVFKSDFLLWATFRLAPNAMYQAMLATPPEVVEKASPDEQARAKQVLDHLLPFSQRLLGALNDAKITPNLRRYELERITAPTLILGVADDLYGTYDGARYSAEHIPHARFVGYPSGGHTMVGRQKEALSEIVTFLKSLHG